MKAALVLVGVVTDLSYFEREWKRIFQIPLSDPRMDDDRRTIHEYTDEKNLSSTQAFLIKQKSEKALGNHFHRDKTELFVIISGRVDRLITTDGKGQHRQELSDIPAGSIIMMPPRVAHALFMAGDSKMLCYATEVYDGTDMPTLPVA